MALLPLVFGGLWLRVVQIRFELVLADDEPPVAIANRLSMSRYQDRNGCKHEVPRDQGEHCTEAIAGPREGSGPAEA